MFCGNHYTLRDLLAGFLSTIFAITMGTTPNYAQSTASFRIHIEDEQSGWPVPLVELRTNHQVRLVSDNAGVIACQLPELMNQETWFEVIGHGYEVPADGFGYQGVRITPQPGASQTVKVRRTSLAKRLGRLTGAGLFAESQPQRILQQPQKTVLLGCDSVQNAVYQGRLFWAWGDTTLAHYPLGIFHMTGATTPLQPLTSFKPPLEIPFEYFRKSDHSLKGIAPLPGSGPTWLTGVVTLPDESGKEQLVAMYRKIKPPLETYEFGLTVWNSDRAEFEPLKALWKAESNSPAPDYVIEGHPCFWTDEAGQKWVLFGNPFPSLKIPASFEAWKEPQNWISLAPPALLKTSQNQDVVPHSGHMAWNEARQKFVAIFVEKFGKPSSLGEVWFAESASPWGPWKNVTKVLSHQNYTFYNPRMHPEMVDEKAEFLLFEGTYTHTFSDHAHPTPRFDYNQILYRLDFAELPD